LLKWLNATGQIAEFALNWVDLSVGKRKFRVPSPFEFAANPPCRLALAANLV
jgi:hypothetical protein